MDIFAKKRNWIWNCWPQKNSRLGSHHLRKKMRDFYITISLRLLSAWPWECWVKIYRVIDIFDYFGQKMDMFAKKRNWIWNCWPQKNSRLGSHHLRKKMRDFYITISLRLLSAWPWECWVKIYRVLILTWNFLGRNQSKKAPCTMKTPYLWLREAIDHQKCSFF